MPWHHQINLFFHEMKSLGHYIRLFETFDVQCSKLGIFPIKGDHLGRIKKVSKDQTLEPSSEIFLDLSRRIFPYNEAEYGSIKDSPSPILSAFEHYYKCSPICYDYTRIYKRRAHRAYCAQKTLIKSRS